VSTPAWSRWGSRPTERRVPLAIDYAHCMTPGTSSSWRPDVRVLTPPSGRPKRVAALMAQGREPLSSWAIPIRWPNHCRGGSEPPLCARQPPDSVARSLIWVTSTSPWPGTCTTVCPFGQTSKWLPRHARPAEPRGRPRPPVAARPPRPRGCPAERSPRPASAGLQARPPTSHPEPDTRHVAVGSTQHVAPAFASARWPKTATPRAIACFRPAPTAGMKTHTCAFSAQQSPLHWHSTLARL
jgi:hypothetical protein